MGTRRPRKVNLQTLASQGITEIVIPGAHKMVSTTKQRTEVEKTTSQSFAGTTYEDQPIEEQPDPDALYVFPVTQDVVAKSGRSEISMSSKAEMTVFRNTQEKKDKFTRLHEFALGNVAQRIANDLDAGQHTINNGVLDVNLNLAEKDAQTNLKNMMYAQSELGVYKSLILMSLNGTSTRTEVHQSNQQVAEVLFTNEDKQTAKKNENKPPSVDSVSFSNKKPRPGDNIGAKIKGSDPEDMALMWEWSWIGKGVKQSGDGTGTTLNLNKLQIAQNANNNDTYGIELTLTDELGAYVTHKQEIDTIKPPEPPQITSASVPSSTGWSSQVQISAKGTDPDGSDANLQWKLRPTGDSAISGLTNVDQKGPSFSTRMRLKTDKGDTAQQTSSSRSPMKTVSP